MLLIKKKDSYEILCNFIFIFHQYFISLLDTFNQSRFSQSMLLDCCSTSSRSSLLDKSPGTLFNHTDSELGNVSEISSNLPTNHHNLTMSQSFISINPGDNNTVGDMAMDGNSVSVLDGHDDNDGGDEARLAIFQSFFELTQQYSKPLEIFDLIDQFDQTCDENMFAYREMLQSKVRPENESTYLSKFSSLIHLERNTWRLVGALCADRLQNHPNEKLIQFNTEIENNKNNMDFEEDLQLRLSDHELVQRALNQKVTLREMQIVIDWLESVYVEELSNDKVQFYSDGPMYWENTLHTLKVTSKQTQQQKSTLSLSLGRLYCKQMDPDAPIRTGMPLHDLDKEDENRLFHYIYKLIRAGQLQTGKDIAEKLGML